MCVVRAMIKDLLLAFCLLATQSDGAGSVGYAACMAGCMSWCSTASIGGPGTYSSCVAGCAIACVCFADDTQATMRDGQTGLAHIKVGDKVLTQDDAGQDVYTTVTQVDYIPGNFSFVALTLNDANRSMLTTTDWHGMPVKTNLGSTMIKEAAKVVEADVLSVRDFGLASVVGIRRFTQAGKYSISTESCTMYANNVLTTTTCMDEAKSKSFVQTMDQPPSLDAAYFIAARGAQPRGVLA